MPKLNEMLTSNYLKAADCDEEDLILTIADIKQATLGQGADAKEKWVLMFREVDKGLVLNVVNTKAIAKLHGDDTDDWVGKKIALYATEVEYAGDTMLGIRVRLKAPKGKARGLAEAAPEPAPAPAAKAAPAAVPAAGVEDDEDEPPF